MSFIKVITLLFLSTVINSIKCQESEQGNQQQGESCPSPCQSTMLTGPAGPAGPPGPTGQPGVQGSQGITGTIGNPGTNGIPGIPGQIGVKGEKGAIGQGSKGDLGDIGPKGDKGDQGMNGTTGPKGIQGVIGPKGIRGLKGVQGQQGVKGDKGEPGDSYTSPSMSAFSARKTSVQQVNLGIETIIFQYEDIDNGEDFNLSTGVFTCPIQGLYYFSFTFLPAADLDFNVYLQQNGNTKAHIYFTVGQRRIMQSHSVILSLQIGDEVKLVANAPTLIDINTGYENIFNGYLIHAM